MRKSTCWLVIATVTLGVVIWVIAGIATYVPADLATAERIVVGMSGDEVQQLFGRPPFQDSNVTLEQSPGIRSLLHGDTTTRDWDGPAGLITVVFDKHDRVQEVKFSAADRPVTFGPWIRTRLGMWP